MSKLYKQKFTKEDIMAVERYIKKNGISLCIEVFQNGSDDGDVYEMQACNLVHAINMADRYYNNVNASKKVVELLLRERNGEFTCIYHIERNKTGLTYEILKYARESA